MTSIHEMYKLLTFFICDEVKVFIIKIQWQSFKGNGAVYDYSAHLVYHTLAHPYSSAENKFWIIETDRCWIVLGKF